MVHKIRISPCAFISGALLLMVVPARWWLGALVAAFFHELAHIAAIYLTGGQITGISIGCLGAKMEVCPMSRGKEALCALAGPLGSFLIAFGLTCFPEMALCAAVQGIFNLLPIYPLDGGRILRVLLPTPVCAGMEVFTVIMLLGVGVWCCFEANLGILSMIPWFAAAMVAVKRKIPCKEPKMAVQ